MAAVRIEAGGKDTGLTAEDGAGAGGAVRHLGGVTLGTLEECGAPGVEAGLAGARWIRLQRGLTVLAGGSEKGSVV
ncbi:hypothetical protein ACH4SK_34120 [Streptomyces inhibens]|uniref:hypothetical protein n=1 Tax=Streptomyces inhibens TaxID=2293571 RepID=UPI0037B046DE